jgi:hypothetical protein
MSQANIEVVRKLYAAWACDEFSVGDLADGA